MSSYTTSSSRSSSPGTSPSMSSSRPIDMSYSSTTSHRSSFSSTRSATSNPYSTCAYPSWPSGSSFQKTTQGRVSSYVSDEDLFGDDDAYLSEPPPPPRPAEAYLARPLLPPVVTVKPRQCSFGPKKKRRTSSIKSKE